MTDRPAEAPDHVPGLDDLLRYLQSREPAVARARIANDTLNRITDEVLDPALRRAWEVRNKQARMRDLASATGVGLARIAWAIGRHVHSD